MTEAEKSVLACLLERRFEDALGAVRGMEDGDGAELLRTVVVDLAAASAYARALCDGRLAAAPPADSNPFCGSLKKIQKMLWPSEMWADCADKTPVPRPGRGGRYYDKDIETGLLSRRAFLWNVRALIEDAPDRYGVMFSVGLDNLRYVNETHGYDSGDIYIAKVVEILRLCEGERVLLARPAGDEFAVYAHDFESEGAALDFAQETRKRLLNTTLQLPGETVRLRTSQGAAIYPSDAVSSDVLLNYASNAMFSVQNFNRGTFLRFNPEAYRAKAAMMSRQERLDELLEERRIHFAFQPIVNLHDGSIYGYEALMRSTRSDFPSPLDILQLAEVQYKLPQLEYVTFLVIFDWVAQHMGLLSRRKIFFNIISANYLTAEELRTMHPDYANIVRHMVIEITETASSEKELTRRISQFRKDFSTLIAIDDYGVANSNIYRLVNLAPEIVKLDRFFISDIHKASPDRQKLVTDFITYCHSKGILTVAEGVETGEELACVIRMGFDLCQGYYLGRPEFQLQELKDEHVLEIRRQAAARASA
ncbi:MAG: EAL domain-containing protein [Desulfovibrio desulfuricans]|nr:EAL domain-containing protein [Desulfovibrio desulfuricans]